MTIDESEYNIIINGLRKQLELHNRKQQELIRHLESLKELRQHDEKVIKDYRIQNSKLDACLTRCLNCGERVALSIDKSIWVHITEQAEVMDTKCLASVYSKKQSKHKQTNDATNRGTKHES